MAACVPAPPYMLGERPTPLRGGGGSPSFRQVPFVRVSDRVESGVKVRKQLRKYLKAASATQHLVAQMHLSDACVTAMQPQEVAQSCFANFFDQMKRYNQVLGEKHLAASKAYVEMTRPLDNSGRSRKWTRDVYNLVQKCVQDVGMAERKMEKARTRKERAEDELTHWRTVLEANEATYQVQPSNPEVIRAYQLAQYRFSSAFTEDEGATMEYEEAKTSLYATIERRDQVVEEATELSQSAEEDRMDTMLIVINQFVETKVAILQAEIEAMTGLQQYLKDMDRESVVQQYIVDSMQPELTHRHAKALYILEWHRLWHQEQSALQAAEPMTYLALSPDDVVKVKAAGISANDVEIIKDFIASCFVDPDPVLVASASADSASSSSSNGEASGSSKAKPISAKHRARFTDPSALGMYRIAIVRRVVLSCLNHQRARSLELSSDGFARLSETIRLLLDACSEKEDTKTIKNLMNMIQTFYRVLAPGSSNGGEEKKEYLHASLIEHKAWSVPEYWGNALLVSIGEELSKNPQDAPWYFLPGPERAQLVLQVHNVVYGQVTSFVYHLMSFGYSRRQIFQWVQNVCWAYELGEEQRISLSAAVQSLQLDESALPRGIQIQDAFEEVQFTSFTLPDWTSLPSGSNNTPKFRPFGGRNRGTSTTSEATTRPTDALSRTSSFRSTLGGGTASMRDLEEMKTIVSNSMAATLAAGEESWEDLFGSRGAGNGGGGAVTTVDSDDGASEKGKKPKKKKNSRRFNDQLRLARSMPLSQRMHDEPDHHDSGNGSADSASSPVLQRPHSSHNILMRPERIPEEAPRKKSSDEPVVLLRQDTAPEPGVQKRHKKRGIKSRSAASIDTSGLATGLYASSDAPSPVPTSHYEISARASSSAAAPAPAPTGMDHIKTIAAQMKQRRKAATDTPPTSNGGSASAPPPLSAERGGSPEKQKEPPLSGVAALRARFEKR